MRSIHEFRGMFAGKEVWVLGNGPSLWKVPLGAIPVDRAIGCNRILKTHACAFVTVVDEMVWDEQQDRFRSENVKLIVSRELYEKRIAGNYPEERVWSFGTSKKAIPMVSSALYHGFLTGYYAAEIACRMASCGGRVVLAGMDLRYTDEMKERNETHASGDERPNGATDLRFPEGRRALKWLSGVAYGVSSISMSVVYPSALELDGFPEWRI